MKTKLTTVIIVFVAMQANARWAMLYFTPGVTNEYGFTVDARPKDATNGILFEVEISSTDTNEIPKTIEQISFYGLSTGRLPASEIDVITTNSSAKYIFVIPSNDLDSAEFIWGREYQGFYQKLGGANHIISLKKFYEYYRAKQKSTP